MLRIRFHGRGGQGVKTASQVLGSALFAEGFEVQDSARYGAERRGAPVFAYVRADRSPIRERGVIERPDLIVVVDETLLALPAAGVLQGAGPGSVMLAGSAAGMRFPGRVVPLPRTEARFAGAAGAGAAARLLGVVRREILAQAIESELGTPSAEVLAAFDAMAPQQGIVREGAVPGPGGAPPEWIEPPLEDVALAAPAIHAAATSVVSETGLWRTLRPVIDDDLCRRCHWVCATYCPDSAISADAQGRPEIDYAHCKGCMLCVSVCPPHAIRAVPERAAQERAA